MKAICTKLACFLLVLLVSGVAMAESITSPKRTTSIEFFGKCARRTRLRTFLQRKAGD